MSTGECLHTFAKHSTSVPACAWLSDDRYFVSAGVDKQLHVWCTDGDVVQTWRGPRIGDLAVAHDGARLVASTSDQRILLCDISRSDGGAPWLCTSEVAAIDEAEPIKSLSLSADGRTVLVTVASDEVHAWDLQRKVQLHRYRGPRQGRYIIRTAFGGSDECLVVSGSEDSLVYIWSRHTAALLEVLPGHSGTVNAVACSPANPLVLASASDDHTVCIWGVGGER